MKRLSAVMSAVVALALTACGGSSSSNPTGSNASAVRVSQGALTQVQGTSIVVNGTTFDDSSASVTVDDNPTGHEALQPGMVVTVKIDDKGKVTEVHSRADIRGKATVVSPSTMTVAGRTVRLDDATQKPAGVSTGDHVRVNGFTDDKGDLHATRVDKSAAGTDDFEVKGVVSNLTSTGFTLTSGSTEYTVSLASGATLPAGLANGAAVEVKSATQPTGTAITASSVKVDDDHDLGENQEAEVEGIVASVAGAAPALTLTVNGHTVTTTSSTKWVGGAPTDLIAGVRIEAEGALDASGNLAATKVVFKDSLRIQGAVTNVAPAATAGTTNGTFQMFGGKLTVVVSDATRFDDASNLPNLSALTTQNVEVRGYPSAASATQIVATRIKLGSGGGGGGGASTRIFLQGPVSNVNPTAKTFTILSITVDATQAGEVGRDDSTQVSASFDFSKLADGTVVKARADGPAAFTAATSTLVAKEVEIEDDK